MNIPPLERDGYIYFLKDIQENKQYFCKEGCIKYSDCCIEPYSKGSFFCTEVTLQIIATSSVSEEKGAWRMGVSDYMLIGTDGYPYKGIIPCDKIAGKQHYLKNNDTVFKSTKANIVIHFPKLLDGVSVREIIIKGRPQLTFVITEDNSEEYNLDTYLKQGVISQQKTTTSNEKTLVRKRGERGLIYELNLYKTLIFQRFNTRLTYDEIRDIDKKIGEQQSIVQNYFNDDEKKHSPELQELCNEYKEQAAYYREMYFEKYNAEKERLIRIMHITDILNLSPDEFERLCGEVMTKMGYYDVMVTPHSNDKGIDVYGKLDGKIVVAQCKRYRNSVGTPDIQRFIGAMHTSGAKRGIFFTTATFTSEAANMAQSTGITLFDKTAFSNMLSLHQHLDVEKDTPQPSLWGDIGDLPE